MEPSSIKMPQNNQINPTESTPPPPSVPPITPPRKPKTLILILSFITLLSLATATYFFYQTQILQSQTESLAAPQDAPLSDTTPTSLPDPTANWDTYTTDVFTFKYPTDFSQNIAVSSGPINNSPELLIAIADPTTVQEGSDAPFDGFSVYTLVLKPSQTMTSYIATEKSSFENLVPNTPSSPSMQNQVILNNQTWHSLSGPNHPKSPSSTLKSQTPTR
jgi:hypothetical protein